MKLVNVSEMKEIEKEANRKGHSYDRMMDLAGEGTAEIILSFYGYCESPSIIGLVGSGNNGGDTLVALGHLAKKGWKTLAYLVKDRPKDDQRLNEYQQKGGLVERLEKDIHFSVLDQWLEECHVLVDGVYGTGVRQPVPDDITDLFNRIVNSKRIPYVVAIDCPSGINCDTGEVYLPCIPADVTVCMGAVKEGLLKFPAYNFVGDIEIVDIGIPNTVKSWQMINRWVADTKMVHNLLPERRKDTNKGSFGTCLIVAGSINYTGAVLLAARAAYKVGTGLIRTAVPGPLHGILAGQLPESTWILLPHEMGVISDDAADILLRNLDRVSCILLGPGLGLEDTTSVFLQRVLQQKTGKSYRGSIGFVGSVQSKGEEAQSFPPCVIDADGLKLISRIPDWHRLLETTAVLTPHPGEMAVMTGLSVKEIQSNREAIAVRYAKEWNHVVVLKGALTVIADPSGKTCLIPVATSALAKAGTGDVLAGVIAGLRAQGVDPYSSAVVGAYIHAQAGLMAAEKIGHEASVLASDVIDLIPHVLSSLW